MMIEFLERLLDSIKSFPHLREITYVYEMYKKINTCRCNYERNSVSTDRPWWSHRPGVSEAFETGNEIQLNTKDAFVGVCGYHDKWKDSNLFTDENGSATCLEIVRLGLEQRGVRALMVAEDMDRALH